MEADTIADAERLRALGDIPKAVAILRPLVALGDMKAAQSLLNCRCYSGQSSVSKSEILALLQLLANNDDSQACFELAYELDPEWDPMDENGDEFWHNTAAGKAMLEKAATLGHHNAILSLAIFHKVGHWNDGKDEARARSYYAMGVSLGHVYSVIALGVMMWKGEGGPEDKDRAMELWLSVPSDSPDRRWMKEFFRDGWYGIPADIELAKRWE